MYNLIDLQKEVIEALDLSNILIRETIGKDLSKNLSERIFLLYDETLEDAEKEDMETEETNRKNGVKNPEPEGYNPEEHIELITAVVGKRHLLVLFDKNENDYILDTQIDKEQPYSISKILLSDGSFVMIHIFHSIHSKNMYVPAELVEKYKTIYKRRLNVAQRKEKIRGSLRKA